MDFISFQLTKFAKYVKKQKFKMNVAHKVNSVERVGDEVIVKADNK